MNRNYRVRQADIIPENIMYQEIQVVGVGAVGSHLVYTLARMGFTNITVWDEDKVSEENISNQGFQLGDIGDYKVEAVKRTVYRAVGTTIKTMPKMWTDELLSGVVVAAADSMAVRRALWERNTCSLFIDTRMAAEAFEIFIHEPFTKEYDAHENALFTDKEAVQVPCTAKATIYCASLITALVAANIKTYLKDRKYNGYTSWNINSGFIQL